MTRRKTRTFRRTYMGQDGLTHLVHGGALWATCGQSIIGVRYWGGSKVLTCLMCIGGEAHG